MNKFHFKNLFIKFTTRNTGSVAFNKPIEADRGKYILLFIPVATFGLGTWQIQRRKWKLNLIKNIEDKINMPPIDLPENIGNLSDLEYRKVHVKGTFDHSKEVYIGPRSLVSEGGYHAGSKFNPSPETGNFVVTPFHLSDRNLTILVNRGWVPKKQMSPDTRLNGQVEGEVSLVGFLRNSEKKPFFAPKNDPSKNYFYFRDIKEIAQKCNAAPIFIDADVKSSVPSGPVGGQTRLTIRNEHLNYIITWYSLSALTAVMWFMKYGQTLKKI